MLNQPSPDIVQSIDDYLNGKLDSTQVDALWARLMQYPEYYPLLETQAALKKIDVADFRKKLEEGYDFYPKNNNKKRRSRQSNLIWIGSLAAIIVFSLLINLLRTAVETTLSPAITQIHASHLVSPDVSRSSRDDMTELELGLYRAYLLSISGNLDGAVAEYEKLAEFGEPGLGWIRYNLGIVHFNAGNHNASAAYFRDVDCSAVFEEPGRAGSCYWFKTNSMVAAGELEQAWVSGNRAIELSTYFRNDAIELLRKVRHVLGNKYQADLPG